MGKVSFDPGINSVQGLIMGSDPFYLRRYRCKDGRLHGHLKRRHAHGPRFRVH